MNLIDTSMPSIGFLACSCFIRIHLLSDLRNISPANLDPDPRLVQNNCNTEVVTSNTMVNSASLMLSVNLS